MQVKWGLARSVVLSVLVGAALLGVLWHTRGPTLTPSQPRVEGSDPGAYRSVRSLLLPGGAGGDLDGPVALQPRPVPATTPGARPADATTTAAKKGGTPSPNHNNHHHLDSQHGPHRQPLAAEAGVAAGETGGYPRSREYKAEIPRIIHQTWKTKNVPNPSLQRTWTHLNPTYEYRLYTDADMEVYMAEHHPEMMAMYRRMQVIQRADLFRYIVLYDVGGVYADIDVTCSAPIDSWLRQTNDFFNVGLMVGFEALTGTRPDWYLWYARKFQMCQWTIASAPQHPALANVLDAIVDVFDSHTDEEIIKIGIMESTGPGIWSDAVTEHLHDAFNVSFGQEPFTSEMLKERFVHIGSTLLLPMRSFAVNSGGYSPRSGADARDVFVRHGFAGSWQGEERKIKREYDKIGPYCRNVGSGANVCVSVSNGDKSEGPVQLMDGKKDTKLSARAEDGKPLNITYTTLGKLPVHLEAYSLRSAHDHPERDPSNWKLYGRKYKQDWVLLDEQTGVAFEGRTADLVFPLKSREAGDFYLQFRLMFPGIPALQIGNFALKGHQ